MTADEDSCSDLFLHYWHASFEAAHTLNPCMSFRSGIAVMISQGSGAKRRSSEQKLLNPKLIHLHNKP